MIFNDLGLIFICSSVYLHQGFKDRRFRRLFYIDISHSSRGGTLEVFISSYPLNMYFTF